MGHLCLAARRTSPLSIRCAGVRGSGLKSELKLPRYPITIQRLIDRIQQVLVAKGFRQELHRAGFHGLHRHRNIPMPRDEDYWNLKPRFGQLVLKIQTADSGKSHIQNKTTWPIRSLAEEEL